MAASAIIELHASPGASFDEPFEMLGACHERVTRMLALLQRLRDHLPGHGADAQAAQAARDVMRYFDDAAPRHHDDEELHVLPVLRAVGRADVAERLHADHLAMHAAWAELRMSLQQVAEGRWQPADEPALNTRAQAFAALYRDHVPLEDDVAYPLVRQHIGAEALQAMSLDMAARRGVR